MVSNGQERSSKKPVQIHLFPSNGSAEAQRLWQLVLSLPDTARSRIVRFGQGEGGHYFVTEPIPDGLSLRTWIEREATSARARSVPAVSANTAGNLRQMEIHPAPLSPMLPGPETVPPEAAGLTASSTQPSVGTVNSSAKTPTPNPVTDPVPRSGEATVFMRQLYDQPDGPVAPVPGISISAAPISPVSATSSAARRSDGTTEFAQMLQEGGRDARVSPSSNVSSPFVNDSVPTGPPFELTPGPPAGPPPSRIPPSGSGGETEFMMKMFGSSGGPGGTFIPPEQPRNAVPAPPSVVAPASPGLGTWVFSKPDSSSGTPPPEEAIAHTRAEEFGHSLASAPTPAIPSLGDSAWVPPARPFPVGSPILPVSKDLPVVDHVQRPAGGMEPVYPSQRPDPADYTPASATKTEAGRRLPSSFDMKTVVIFAAILVLLVLAIIGVTEFMG